MLLKVRILGFFFFFFLYNNVQDTSLTDIASSLLSLSLVFFCKFEKEKKEEQKRFKDSFYELI